MHALNLVAIYWPDAFHQTILFEQSLFTALLPILSHAGLPLSASKHTWILSFHKLKAFSFRSSHHRASLPLLTMQSSQPRLTVLPEPLPTIVCLVWNWSAPGTQTGDLDSPDQDISDISVGQQQLSSFSCYYCGMVESRNLTA